MPPIDIGLLLRVVDDAEMEAATQMRECRTDEEFESARRRHSDAQKARQEILKLKKEQDAEG